MTGYSATPLTQAPGSRSPPCSPQRLLFLVIMAAASPRSAAQLWGVERLASWLSAQHSVVPSAQVAAREGRDGGSVCVCVYV